MGKKPRKVAYVVRRGRKTGIFYTWDECDEQVKGFPDNNYEGYTVLEDAERAWEKHLRDLQDIANKASMNETPQRKENQDSNSPRGEKPQFKRPLSLDSDDSDEDGPPKKRRFNVSNPGPDIIYKEEQAIVLIAEQEAVVEMALEGRNIFLTGAGGSGKTATVKRILARFEERKTKFQVVAPTGIAALPLRGMTTYAFLGLKPDSLRLPVNYLAKKSKNYIRKRIEKLTVIIVDEISMVDSQFLDRMDRMVQAIMGCSRPFGGKQVIFVGDFHQLPPVRPFQFCLECGNSMSSHQPFRCVPCKSSFTEGDKWAFRSAVWKKLDLRHVQLEQIHRQKDGRFQTILNKIRNGIYLDDDEWRVLEGEKNYDPNFCAVRLMALRKRVDDVNRKELAAIKSPVKAWTSLDFQQDNALAEEHFKNHRMPQTLILKLGAKVVLLTNLDPKRGLVNGSQGEVVGFQDIDEDEDEQETSRKATFDKRQKSQFHSINKLAPVVQFTNGIRVTITAVATSSLVASKTQDDPSPKVVCRTQIPLALAWALTIHKSQGMTLEYLEVSSKDIFERGQLYVALSRGTSLEGTTLTGYTREQLPVDSDVVEFYENTEWEALGSTASAVQETARPREPSPELEEDTDYGD